MSGLAAFSCHNNIRPIALEGSRWGFGVVHDKVPAESSYEAIFEQCVADCAQRLTMQQRVDGPSPGCTDPPRAGIFINFYHVLSLLQNT